MFLCILTRRTHLAAPCRRVIPHLLHHLVHRLAAVHRVQYHACSWGASSHVRDSSSLCSMQNAWQVVLGAKQASKERTTMASS